MPAIDRRVALGRLHVVHHGVYAVGHPALGRSGRWMAAVLACGPDAALSHASAAALWALQRGEPNIVDVTAQRTGRKRPGIRIHRPRVPAETTTHDAIPVTTPARTILDLAATVSASRLEHLLDQAEIRELTDYPALDALARAHPRPPRSQAPDSSPADLLRRHGPDPQRPRDPLQGPLPHPPPADPARRSADRRQARRLPLRRTPPDRRDRQLALPQDPPRLRGRQSERRLDHTRRLPHAQVHRPPTHQATAPRGKSHRRRPRRPPRRVAAAARASVRPSPARRR